MTSIFPSKQIELVKSSKFKISNSWNYSVSTLARMYLQLPLHQWSADNVYLLVLASWKVNIAENPIAVIGLQICPG